MCVADYQSLADKYIKGSGEFYADKNPADESHILAKFRLFTADDAKRAVENALSNYQVWSSVPPPKRGAILLKAGELMESNAEELAMLITLEEGKTLSDSRAEVARSYALLKFYGAMAYKLGGITLPSADRNTRILTTKESIGVVLAITPWNFPLSIPVWKVAPALAAGDAVVLKPASKTPLITAKLLEILETAGLPKGVFQIVVGRGNEVGDALVMHEDITAVSLTGSTAVGQDVWRKVGAKSTMTRIQLELGGKNALYIDSEADLALAVELSVRSAFGLTGQSCTAASRLIVHKNIEDQFKVRLIDRLKEWKVGPGNIPDTDMGPVVDQSQFEKDLEYIRIGSEEGGKLLHGGKRLQGLFLEPTVFDDISPEMRIFNEEIFGPILSITSVDSLEKAIELVNSVKYGHTAGIVSRNLHNVNIFIDKVEAGVIKVNKPTIGLELQAPFGGFKKSSANTWKELGEEALEFYTREKTVYLGY